MTSMHEGNRQEGKEEGGVALAGGTGRRHSQTSKSFIYVHAAALACLGGCTRHGVLV